MVETGYPTVIGQLEDNAVLVATHCDEHQTEWSWFVGPFTGPWLDQYNQYEACIVERKPGKCPALHWFTSDESASEFWLAVQD